MDIGSELMLISGDPKKHCGPPVKMGAYEGQVIDGVWAEVQLTVGPVCPQTHPAVAPVPECTTGSDILRSWQNLHSFPPLWSEGYDSWKVKWKPFSVAPPRGRCRGDGPYHTSL